MQNCSNVQYYLLFLNKSLLIRADLNKDGNLDLNELETWMINKVKDHFQTAVRDNYLIFTALDKDHNGKWQVLRGKIALIKSYIFINMCF